MPGSIRDRVAILGMGCTRFGERWDASAPDLLVDSAYQAFEDAGIGPEEIQAAWLGTTTGSTGMVLSEPLRLPYIPITRVENACATASDAFRNACYAVAAGMYDIVLAIGVDKFKDSGISGLGDGGTPGPGHAMVAESTPPRQFAMLATTYFNRYGLSYEEGKHMIARVSWKSHQNGVRNKNAHFQRAVDIETMINAPMVAWPLGLYDCCGVATDQRPPSSPHRRSPRPGKKTPSLSRPYRLPWPPVTETSIQNMIFFTLRQQSRPEKGPIRKRASKILVKRSVWPRSMTVSPSPRP